MRLEVAALNNDICKPLGDPDEVLFFELDENLESPDAIDEEIEHVEDHHEGAVLLGRVEVDLVLLDDAVPLLFALLELHIEVRAALLLLRFLQ